MFNGREVFKRRLSLLAAVTVASVGTALVAVPATSAQAYALTGCKYASPKPFYIQRGQRVTDDYWSAPTQASGRWNSSRLPTKFQPATGTRPGNVVVDQRTFSDGTIYAETVGTCTNGTWRNHQTYLTWSTNGTRSLNATQKREYRHQLLVSFDSTDQVGG